MRNLKSFITVIFLLFVFWRLFFPLTPRVANDFPYIYPEYLWDILGPPQMWSGVNIFGVNSSPFNWSYISNLLYSIGNALGMNFALIQRIFGILPIIIIAVFSINKFLIYFKVSANGRLIGLIFYMSSTYILLLIDGGQFLVAGAYAVFPYTYISFERALARGLRTKILAGLVISILGFFDIRFIYVLGVLLLLRFLYQFLFLEKTQVLTWVKSWVNTGAIVVLIAAGLHAFWLLPTVVVRPQSPEYAVGVLGEVLSNIGHIILFQQPQWYENVFGVVSNLHAAFVLIPFLAFTTPLLVRGSKKVGFWLLVAFVGIFLAKGTSGIFGDVYSWLFENIPGFNVFRDSTKFFFVIALSHAYLIGISVDKLSSKFAGSIETIGKKVSIVTAVLIVGFLYLARPVWLGKMIGTFSTRPEISNYKDIEKFFGDDHQFGRILWIPSRHPLGYASPTHPVVEALRISYLHPFVSSAVGKFEFLNFIREATFMGEIFDITGIKYIAHPYPDERVIKLKDDEKDYYYAFSDQISKLPWIEKKVFDFPLNVYKTKKSQDHFFIAQNIFYIVGSDRIYWDLIKVPNFELSKNALVFVEELPEIAKDMAKDARFVLFEKEQLDLALSFISKDNFVFPANDLPSDPESSGWWKRETKDFLWWRDFLQSKYKLDNQDFDYGGGWAIAEGNSQLLISNDEFLMGDKVFARVMQNSRGGKVEFWQNDSLIGEIDTKIEKPDRTQIKLSGYKEIPDQIFEYDKANFKWFEVGELVRDDDVTIKTEGEINVVNSIVSISEGEWGQNMLSVEELRRKSIVINWKDSDLHTRSDLVRSSHNDPNVSYSRLSPTHYKVKVSNLTNPATLVFSEAYDRLWTFNGQNSTKVYSLVNGFEIDSDGEYDVYFEPQKYVLPGLFISGITLLFVLSYFIIARQKPY